MSVSDLVHVTVRVVLEAVRSAMIGLAGTVWRRGWEGGGGKEEGEREVGMDGRGRRARNGGMRIVLKELKVAALHD